MKVAPRASQASREGGCGVAGWQGLKTECGDIADLTPRAREDPPALRITPFQEGEDDEDIGTPGQPMARNIKSKVVLINKRD
jgi:hypothetical protein